MVWKSIWAFIMIWASYEVGHTIGYYHERMTCELKDMVMLSGMIKGELKYALSPLCDVFGNASKRTSGVVSRWLKALSEKTGENSMDSFLSIWEECMKILEAESRLNDKQLKQMNELGNILGYLDVESQLNNLALWEERIRYEYEYQREKTGSVKKTARSLGILGGIFLVIIML